MHRTILFVTYLACVLQMPPGWCTKGKALMSLPLGASLCNAFKKQIQGKVENKEALNNEGMLCLKWNQCDDCQIFSGPAVIQDLSEKVTLAAWGSIRSESIPFGDKLHSYVGFVKDLKNCTYRWENYEPDKRQVGEKNVCASASVKDDDGQICFIDVSVLLLEPERKSVMGIMSQLARCDRNQPFHVFSKLSDYGNWLASTAGSTSACKRKHAHT